MCSCANIYNGEIHFQNWDDNIWPNVLIADPSTSNSICSQYTYPTTAGLQNDSEQSVASRRGSYDNQMQTLASYHNVDSSLLLSPSWEKSPYEVHPKPMTMSTYFSSFNPTSKFQQKPANQIPVRKTSLLKSQNSTENSKLHRTNHIQSANGSVKTITTANGSVKTIAKRKRKRTTFTTDQIEILEQVFSKKPYVTRDERQILVEQLQVNDKSIKVWFQNRRLKNKRCEDEDVVLDKNAILERLDFVESEIYERTDEFGYVTLDDKIMTDLVKVIDDYFNHDVSIVEPKTIIDDSPMYEPISPVSASDYSCEENAPCWQYYEPNELVQELKDIETIITE